MVNGQWEWVTEYDDKKKKSKHKIIDKKRMNDRRGKRVTARPNVFTIGSRLIRIARSYSLPPIQKFSPTALLR